MPRTRSKPVARPPAAPAAPRYAGVPGLATAAEAIRWVEFRLAEGAFGAGRGAERANLWGRPVAQFEAESAHSAISAAEGFALAGGRAVLFAGGADLARVLDMLPAIAGKRLPVVAHATAQALTWQGSSDGPGHEAVYRAAGLGWGILMPRTVQECHDFAVIARRAAENADTPVLVVTDAALATRAASVQLAEDRLLAGFVGAPRQGARPLFDTTQPLLSGAVQDQGGYLQGRIAQRHYGQRFRDALMAAMEEFGALTGRRYGLLRAVLPEGTRQALIGAGAALDTAESVPGVGAISLLSLRPFPAAELAAAAGELDAITVIEQSDDDLSADGPLTREVRVALEGSGVTVYAGVGGLGRRLRADELAAAAGNMRQPGGGGPRRFVLGIRHPEALEPAAAADATIPSLGWVPSVRLVAVGGSGLSETARAVAGALSKALARDVMVELPPEAERCGLPESCAIALAPAREIPDRAGVVLCTADATWSAASAVAKRGDFCILGAGGPEAVAALLPAEALGTLHEREARLWILPAAPASACEWLGALCRVARWTGDGAAELMRDETAHHAHDALREVALPAESLAGAIQISAAPTEAAAAANELVPAGFCERVVSAWVAGRESTVSSGLFAARSLVPAGSAAMRSFRNVTPEIPRFDPARCTGCMDCVCLCPDAAIRGVVAEPKEVPGAARRQFAATSKYAGGLFGIFFDADRCKGCGECVTVCEPGALAMVGRVAATLADCDAGMALYDRLPETPGRFLSGNSLGDLLLAKRWAPFEAGGTSCAGCSESTSLRLMLTATAFASGGEIGVVAGGGCLASFGGSYPFNPFNVPWTRSLDENAVATAIGIRHAWDAAGHLDRRLWVVGSSATLGGGGFAPLARLLSSTDLDINVLVLDSAGGVAPGAGWQRIDIGAAALAFDGAYVAQTTPAHLNHFYRCVLDANGWRGPAVVVSYAACIGEHELAPDQAAAEARKAVDARLFPLFDYHPERGDLLRKRLSLRANSDPAADWTADARTGAPFDVTAYARTESRFAAHFDQRGNPSEALRALEAARLESWHRLQEMAGLR
jgi:pyruvate ferredoxin oxidoreductase beta subunit